MKNGTWSFIYVDFSPSTKVFKIPSIHGLRKETSSIIDIATILVHVRLAKVYAMLRDLGWSCCDGD